MPESKILSLLSMARRAAKISVGFSESKEAAVRKKASLVIVASDISAKTEKEIRFFCKEEIPVVRIRSTIEQISLAIGRKGGVIAVNDQGFADAMLKLKEESHYDD